jgi:hypothetical protein
MVSTRHKVDPRDRVTDPGAVAHEEGAFPMNALKHRIPEAD